MIVGVCPKSEKKLTTDKHGFGRIARNRRNRKSKNLTTDDEFEGRLHPVGARFGVIGACFKADFPGVARAKSFGILIEARGVGYPAKGTDRSPTPCANASLQWLRTMGRLCLGTGYSYLLSCRRSARWLGNDCSACLVVSNGPGTRIVL